MNAPDHDDLMEISEYSAPRPRADRGVRKSAIMGAILGLFALPLASCSDVDDAEREAIGGLGEIPHIEILEVRTGSILPVFSTVDYYIELRLEAGADLRAACEAVRTTMSDLTAGHRRSLQSLSVHQEVKGIATLTGGCEEPVVDSALAAQQAMVPHLSPGAELGISRENSFSSTVAVSVHGGSADARVIAAIRALDSSDVDFTWVSVVPETGERWTFDANRGDDAVIWLEALLSAGVVPREIANNSGFVPVFVQVNPEDLEAALSVPVPPGVREATITDLDHGAWYASQQPSPTS